MKDYEPSLAERQRIAVKARRAQLARARLKAPADDPQSAARQAEPRAAAEAREARVGEHKAAKARQAEEEIAQAAARLRPRPSGRCNWKSVHARKSVRPRRTSRANGRARGRGRARANARRSETVATPPARRAKDEYRRKAARPTKGVGL
jgi:hypothetical protein